jgi:putative membrane protein
MKSSTILIEPLLLLVALLVAIIWSVIAPADYGVWLLEAGPVLLALPLLLATYRRHRLTPLLYRLIFLHSLILLLGAHYTYAQVPLGFWLQDVLDFSRNPYDRIGHIAQGFIPAILAREILLRTQAVRRGWLFFIVLSICLGFSAFYELLEWWTALIGGEAADAFLGTQGDVWDTQWDMFLAMLGAMAAQLLLGRMHDRQLASVSRAVK